MRGSAARVVASLLRLSAGALLLSGGALAAEGPRAPQWGAAGDSAGTAHRRAPAPSMAMPADAGAPIARVELETRGIFDPLPPGPLRPFYRLADRLHVRTRPATLRSQLLLGPGDRWDEGRARESERALRALDIFERVRVESRAEGDSAVVTVRTHDAWTTSPEVSIERGGGRTFGFLQFSERNLFGRAKQLGFAYREEPAGISRSIEFLDPAVGGSRVRAAARVREGSGGTVSAFALEQPFYAEDTRLAFGVRAERSRSQARLYAGGSEAATFYRRSEWVDLYAGIGRRRGRTIGRVTGSLLVWDRTLGGSVLRPGAPPEFAGGDDVLRVRRIAVEGRLWQPRFVERTQVERLDGVEDIDLGRLLALTGGFSPRWFGGSADEGHAALRLSIGVDGRGAGFGWVRASGAGRLVGGPREASGRVEARWVNQSVPRQTLVVAALGAGGYRTARDHQLIVGGLNGLRAHDVHALAGDRLWRVNAESRWLIGRELAQLVSLGAAGFWDAARTRGPGSGGLPWQHDVGVGLRIAMPRSALGRVARFDVAWPVSPAGARGAVFSFSSSQAF